MSSSFVPDSHDPSSGRRGPEFATTHWSVVRAAGTNGLDAQKALEALCSRYWYPLYAFARLTGHTTDDAQELTQGFLASVLEYQTLDRADAEQGRFRSFLLGSFKNYISDQARRAQAQKRGGGRQIISINLDDAEARLHAEPVDAHTPDAIFERRWAMALLDAALQQLQQKYADNGRQMVFEALKSHLGADKDTEPQREIAMRLCMSETAVKVAAHRLRQEFRRTLRREIANTVSSAEDLDDELRRLFTALA